MKRSVAKAVAPYVVILLLCAYLLYHAFGIVHGVEGQLGADFWPKTVLLLAILTCGWEIVAGLRNGAAADRQHASGAPGRAGLVLPPDAEDHSDEVASWIPWVGIALASAYVFLFSEVGYFLATLLFVTAFIYFGNYRRPGVAASVGVVASLAFMFVFMKIVYVSLPMGAGPFGWLSGRVMTAMGIK